LDPQDIAAALHANPLFSALDEEQLERVRRHAHVIDMVEGESLFFQGDEVSSFYLVVEGRIKLYRVSADGKEKIVEIMETGHTFGEALMFMSQSTYPVTATALLPSRVIGINCRAFRDMLYESIDTCFLVMGNLSFRLRGFIREIDALSLDTGTVRIASYLLHKAPADRDSFELDVAKSVIASRLSVKPETFSRILKQLHDKDIVTIEGRQVTILDREAMIRLCYG
jgi:CRP-like cAMP-binding protein